jgi:autophagy-related protein 101
LIIQFLDKKSTKKKTGWFGKVDSSEDLKVWESWIIVVTCLPVQESPDNHDLSVQSFENNLHTIVDIVDTHKDHIPPITSLESSPFPYSIEIEPISLSYRTEGDNESWGKYIKKMLD